METAPPVTLFTLGEVLAVMLAEGGLPLAESTRFRRIVAGSESNVAAGFVRLGHRATLATRVGRDASGDAVEATLRSWRLDAHIGRSDRPTGTIIRGPGTDAGVEAIHLRDGAAAVELCADDVDAAWPEGTGVVFLTGISAVRSDAARGAVERAAELARDGGALVVVDPNIRRRLGTPDQFRDALSILRGRTDVAIGDPAELAVLAGTSERDAVQALIEGGARIVVTKHGALGASATDGASVHSVPSRASAVVDTVGAGDAFAAGFIAGVVEGRSVPDSLELASLVAARVVGTPGDVEGFPWRSSITSHEGASR